MLKLYDNIASVAAQKVRMTLHEKGQTWETAMVDLRKAKGNTDNDIERVIREVWFPTMMQLSPMAVIVGTAAGRLHVGRMFREHGSRGKIFLSEQEARQFLGLPWPIPP